VLSRYIRTVEKEPVESLELLGPWVADKEAFDGWEKAQSEKLKQAESEWKEKYRAADKEQRKELDENRPSGLLAPFPKAKGWKIDADNAEVAIEIARSHMDLNKYREALEIIDCVGKQFGDETRVLSAECAGDLMVKMQMYQKSIDWFEYALKVLNALKSSDGFYGEQVAINVRVKKN
jgi:tetratricopeptide (TPR) repeat protein